MGWLAIALAASMFTSRLAVEAQPLEPAVLERIRAATVYVGVFDPASGSLRASGTGFLISPDGCVLTARHLAELPGTLRVFLSSGTLRERRVPAKIARVDRQSDLALLRIEARSTPYLRMGDSARVRETQTTIMPGFPLGPVLETGETGPAPSFRPGVITSLRRGSFGGLIWVETSTGAEEGSSGSPIVDARGAVIGMVTEVGGRATVLAVPSRRLVAFAPRQARLEERDRAALLRWLADPVDQAQALYECGRFPEARATLAPALAHQPASPRLFAVHASIEDRLGSLDEALAAYERLLQDRPGDERAASWAARRKRLLRYREGGSPGSHFVISAPPREEVAVIDAASGQAVEVLRHLRLSPYFRYRSDGRYAYSHTRSTVMAIDLRIPQEATHLRRDHPECGPPDWVSTSRNGNLVVAAYSPAGEPQPTSSIAVFHGPELKETACYQVPGYFPIGEVSPDGTVAFLARFTPSREGGKPVAQLVRLDLATGATTVPVPEMPSILWMAVPEGAGALYVLRNDHQVARVDLTTGGVLPLPATGIYDLVAGPQPGELLMGGKELVIWRTDRDEAALRIPLPFEAYQVDATTDGAYLFAADSARERVVIIHRASGRKSELHLGPVRSLTPRP